MHARHGLLGNIRGLYVVIIVTLLFTSTGYARQLQRSAERTTVGATCQNAATVIRAMANGPGWVLNTAWQFNASASEVDENGTRANVTVQRSASYSARLTEEFDHDDTVYEWNSPNRSAPTGSGRIDDAAHFVSKDGRTYDTSTKGSGASEEAVQELDFDLERCTYKFRTNFDLKVVDRFGTNPPRNEVFEPGEFQIVDLPIPEPTRPTDKLQLSGFARVPFFTAFSLDTRFTFDVGSAGGTYFNITEGGRNRTEYATIAWEFTSLYESIPPKLQLNTELLERSVFLDQVAVDDQFDAIVDWGDPDEGFLTWRVGPTTDRVGKTRGQQITKNINVGGLGVGGKPVVVQAQNMTGKTSPPQTTRITVAPPPECGGPPSTIQGLKIGGGDVNYKFSFKYPEPVPFKAQTEQALPAALPFFGGGKFGIEESQVSFGVDLRATGEGYAFGAGKTGFAAMKSAITGELTGRADLILQADGVQVQKGELEFKIAGKLKAKEPLLKLITPMGPVVTVIERVPAAKKVVDAASVQIELEPKIAIVLKVKDKQGCLQWDGGEAKPGLGIKASLILDLIPQYFSVTISAGGEGTVYLAVPAPYFRGAEVKFIVGAKVFLYKWAVEGEKAYNARFGGMAAAQDLWERHNAQPTQDGSWQLMDRGYLTAPQYGQWTGTQVTNSADQQLVPNVYPLAHPALLAAPGSANEYLVWSHDKPGSAQLGGDELMFARGSNRNWSNQPVQLTNDDVSDGNPQLAALPNGNALVVWERWDTPNPGDINADLGAVFSHQQVAAGTFQPGSAAPKLTPLQLSTGNTLNYRPQVGALSDGALAVWVNNPNNQLLGDAANPDTLMFARYTTNNGGTWTPAAPAVANLAGLRDFQLAAIGNGAALVWSQDTDGDLQSEADTELFYALWQAGGWGSAQRLTTNSVADLHPMLKLSDTGTPLLVWQQGETLQWLHDSWDATPQTLPYTLDEGQSHWDLQRGKGGSLALTWQEAEGNDTRVGYAVYDGKAQTWSDARTVVPPTGTHELTGVTALVSNVAPALVTGEAGVPESLAFAYQLIPLTPTTRTLDGESIPNVPQAGLQQLRIAHVPLEPNLQIGPADLTASPVTAQEGELVTIGSIIHNTGIQAIAGGTAELISRPAAANGGGTVIATQPFGVVPGGGTTQVNWMIPRPATAEQKFVVRVKPAAGLNETNLLDNEATVGTELVATALATEYLPGGVAPQIRIERQGALPYGAPLTATLRLDDPNGPVIQELKLQFPTTPTTPVTLTGWIPADQLTPGRHLVYWNVDAGERLGERNRNDNFPVTAVRVQSDLATDPVLVWWNRTPGASAPFRMVVRNDGNIAASGGSVAVWDGEPGQAESHLLGRFDVPTLAAGVSAEINGTLNLSNLPVATTGLQGVYVQLDPDNTLIEINENNNLVMVGGVLGGPVAAPTMYTVYLPVVQR